MRVAVIGSGPAGLGAAGVLASGVNVGSYFVGFGDDATSANANRAPNALSQNTDYIDDLLRRDIALPVVTGTAAGGAGALTATLVVGTFLGNAGTPNTAVGLQPFFHLTDDSDNDIVDGSGTPIVVTSLTLTGPDAIGVGFSQNTVTANFSQAVPTGRNYRVYYSTRSNLATLPTDAFTNIRIRAAQEVGAEVETLFQRLHGNSLAWDAAWTSTIWDLALRGLDESLNRSTAADSTAPAGWPTALANNTAGSGAWFTRTGPGLTGYSLQTVAGMTYTGGVSWLGGALLGAICRDTGPSGAGTLGATARVGGETTGFFFLGNRRFTRTDAESLTLAAPAFASIYHGESVEVNGSTPDATMYTWLPGGTAGIFSGGNVLTVAGPAYFSQSSGTLTAIACQYDLLEINFGDGQLRQYVIGSINASNLAVTLVNKDGSTPNIPALTRCTIARWIRTAFGVFENVANYQNTVSAGSGPGHLLAGFIVASPPKLSSGSPIPYGTNALFFASDVTQPTPALEWGGYSASSQTYIPRGVLSGDGSLVAQGTSQFTALTVLNDLLVSGNGTFAQNLNADVMYVKTRTLASASSPVAHNLSTQGAALALTTVAASPTLTINLSGCPSSSASGSYSSTTFKILITRGSGALTSVVVQCLDGAFTAVPFGVTLATYVSGIAYDLVEVEFIGGIACCTTTKIA